MARVTSLLVAFGLLAGACSDDAGDGGCPAGPPADGADCSDEGRTCEYAGSACGSVARCTGGSWRNETVCPPGPECPEALPSEGEGCSLANPASGPLVCSYEPCPEGTLGGPRWQATCNGTEWAIVERECRLAITCGECPPGRNCDRDCEPGEACGSNQCEEGHLCLKTIYPSGEWAWDCATNHCGSDPLDCSCVGAVCGQRGFPGEWECTAASAPAITCECVAECS